MVFALLHAAAAGAGEFSSRMASASIRLLTSSSSTSLSFRVSSGLPETLAVA